MKDYRLYKTESGSIINKDRCKIINKLAVVVDREDGVLLKYGDVEKDHDWLIEYLEKYKRSFEELGLSNDLVYLEFDLSVEDTCTMLNYITQVSGGIKILIELRSREKLETKLAELRELGY